MEWTMRSDQERNAEAQAVTAQSRAKMWAKRDFCGTLRYRQLLQGLDQEAKTLPPLTEGRNG